jgi:ferredoxin
MAKAWIDADACMGAGTCAQVVPEVFHPRHDGTWAVKEEASYFGLTTVFDGLVGDGHGLDGVAGQARIPDHLVSLVVEAAEECPAECIFVELS